MVSGKEGVFLRWSGRGPNPRPLASEEDALSTPLRPTWHFCWVYDWLFSVTSTNIVLQCSGHGQLAGIIIRRPTLAKNVTLEQKICIFGKQMKCS